MLTSLRDGPTLRNGVTMPWIGLGTWQTSEGDIARTAVRTAIQAGYRHIDTATIYANERGVGEGARESGVKREEIFITTKAWNQAQREGPEAVLKAFDESLRKLGTHYVDLYLVHWPVKGKYHGTWKVLESLHAQGRARAIGVSNFLPHHLDDLLPEVKVVPMVNQIEWHVRLMQRPLMDLCRKHAIQLESWSPLMQGKVLVIPELQELARKYNKTVAQIVIRWNLQHQVVTIPKSINPQRIRENAAVFDFELAEGDMRAIDALDQNQRIGANPDTFTF